jgi:hypothetical protein
VPPRDDDGAAGGGAAATPTPVAASETLDDEAFARRLQEEENQRFERERAESRRRAEAWRRTHDALTFAADDLYDDDEDDEDDLYDDDEDDDDITGDEDEELDSIDGSRFSPFTSATNANDADAARRGTAARRARARMARMHRFFGAMHAHIAAAGGDARERSDLAALVLSDRDFTDADYERLLTLDNVSVKKKGLDADAMARRGVVTETWGPPTKTRRSASSLDADCDSSPKCAVCLECFERGQSVSRLPCTHQYHHACIEKWLATHVECPVCRVDLAGDERR